MTSPTSKPTSATAASSASSKWIPWLLLLPPAILVGVYLLVLRVTGPFFLAANVDPDYAYLFNGLNIAVGEAPEHTDHPGTPLQLLGAAWIRLLNLGKANGDIAVNTIVNSEDRLGQLNLLVFILLLGALTADRGDYLPQVEYGSVRIFARLRTAFSGRECLLPGPV